jgi:hypothetical protein
MKDVVVYVTACHGYSERRACALTRQARSTQRKPSQRNPHTAIRRRMHEIAQTQSQILLQYQAEHRNRGTVQHDRYANRLFSVHANLGEQRRLVNLAAGQVQACA